MRTLLTFAVIALAAAASGGAAFGQKTEKPVLHGREWVAVTGKPLAATAGARTSARLIVPYSASIVSSPPGVPGVTAARGPYSGGNS